ncbi:hypothetical protein V2J09_022731 [Rumex salicifolius]
MDYSSLALQSIFLTFKVTAAKIFIRIQIISGQMMPAKWLWQLFLVLCGALPRVLGAYVGVNIGTDLSNMSSPSDVVKILKAQQITHVRLFDADPKMLTAFANTSIEVMVGVTNKELLGIGRSPSVAAAWINQNVAAYVPRTNITTIVVGSEVLTSAPHTAPVLVLAMNNLHLALVAAELNFRVKISTPHSMDIISRPFPPSTATFNSSWNVTIYQVLQFLKNTNSFFMLNAYPYYGYTDGGGIFPLDYALFQPLSSVKQIVDPNTLYHYDSMFDSMVDAAYYSIQALNFSQIPIVVTETGWPWQGGDNESDATLDNAETYNNNLIRRVLNNSGPPSQRNMPINTYIYELFNEDARRGPVSEKNWGIFFSNGTSVYPLSLTGSGESSSSAAFCIAKADADSDKLRDGLDWACGHGHANCSAIQVGQPCYYPDNLQNHASYAYNDYYQRMHSVGGTCDFDGTATTTSADPSYGSCVFTGSINGSASSGGFSSPAFGPVSPLVGSSSTLLPSVLPTMSLSVEMQDIVRVDDSSVLRFLHAVQHLIQRTNHIAWPRINKQRDRDPVLRPVSRYSVLHALVLTVAHYLQRVSNVDHERLFSWWDMDPALRSAVAIMGRGPNVETAHTVLQEDCEGGYV